MMIDRRAVIALLIALLIVLGSCMAAQTSGAQTIPTVTPLPGPVATQQAAQQKIDQAQQNKASADDAAAHAAQQSRQAQDSINAAQNDYNAAQAAINAQQIAVANDLIGQGNLKVQSALQQIDQLMQSVNVQKAIVDDLSTQHISDTLTIRDLARDKQTILTNYNATAAQLAQLKAAPPPPSFDARGALAVIGLLVILLLFAVYVLSRRAPVTVVSAAESEVIEE